MSKKKQRENAVTTPEDTAAANEPAAATAQPATPITAIGEATPLLAEVQSFLSKRDELARKLAEEITATEAKLAELKKTAASLFPETAAASAPIASRDKKLKKLPKAKPLPMKSEGVAAAEASAPSDEPNPVVSNSADDATNVD